MKKFLVVLVAALAAVAMVTPVMAEDRLSLSGSMMVRGLFYDAEFTEAGVTTEDSGAWNDSRLRVGGKIAVADGVSVNFRFDAVESGENSSDATAWGFNPNSSVTSQYAQRRGDIQFDKAYLQFEKAGYTVAAGQMYFRQGMTGNMMDVVGAGFSVAKSGLKLQHVKVSDKNEGNDSFDKDATTGDYADPDNIVQVPTQESSLTGVMYKIALAEGMSLTPMATYRFVSGDGDRIGAGADFMGKFGPVNLKAALEYFTGENALDSTIDEEGMNLFVDASVAVSDTATVGAHLLYAAGNEDGTENQVSQMNESWNNVDYTFADFSPLTYGYQSTIIPLEIDAFEAGDDTGIIAIQAYSDVKFSDALAGKFAVAYAMSEEDVNEDLTAIVVNASVAYKVVDNTTLTAHVNYLTGEEDISGDELDALQVVSGLVVAF